MIARYSQIKQQVESIVYFLERPGHIQKIYSTSRFISLQVRATGKNINIYIGRGGGCEGIWLGEKVPIPFLRKRDRWLEWFRKKITSSLLIDLEIDPIDRAVRLKLQKSGNFQWLYLSWLGREVYFALYDEADSSWMKSWSMESTGENGFEVFNEVGRKKNQNIIQNEKVAAASVEEMLLGEEELAKRQATPKKKIKSAEVKIEKINHDLLKIREWKLLKESMENFDPSELENLKVYTFGKIKIKFPPGCTVWQKRDLIFENIKKLKEIEKHQMQRLNEAIDELGKLKENSLAVENNLKTIQPYWKFHRSEITEVITKKMSDYAITQFEGYKIGIGLSANGNDHMRNSWASNEDWWVHAAHGASAHAIIKLESTGVPTEEHFKNAALLIAKQSGITAAELEIISTIVKNVRGVSGSPGMVTYKKPKKLLCILNQ